MTNQSLLCNTNVKGKFKTASFDDFKNEILNKRAIETIIQWANDFPTDFTKKAYPSIYIFSGVNGVGKTHLAAATINELANRDKDKDWGSWGYHFETITSIKNAVKERELDRERKLITRSDNE